MLFLIDTTKNANAYYDPYAEELDNNHYEVIRFLQENNNLLNVENYNIQEHPFENLKWIFWILSVLSGVISFFCLHLSKH